MTTTTTSSDKTALFSKLPSSFICSISTKVPHHSKYTWSAHTSFLLTVVPHQLGGCMIYYKVFPSWPSDRSAVSVSALMLNFGASTDNTQVCVCECETHSESCWVFLRGRLHLAYTHLCVTVVVSAAVGLDFICFCCDFRQALLIKLMLFEVWFWFQFDFKNFI